MLKRLTCWLFHWHCYERIPWGIHHYDCTCLKCGRRWHEYE